MGDFTGFDTWAYIFVKQVNLKVKGKILIKDHLSYLYESLSSIGWK